MTVTKLVIMKKLFTLSVVLLLISNIFGQKPQGIFKGWYYGNMTFPSAHISNFYLDVNTAIGRESLDTIGINDFINNFYDKSMGLLKLATYSFVDTTDRDNKKLYMLSYDTLINLTYRDNENVYEKVVPYTENAFYGFNKYDDWRAERELYLYCWSNNKWTKASEPIQRDVWVSEVDDNGNRWISADTYLPRTEGANGENNVGTYVKELSNGEIEMKLTCRIIGNDYRNIESRCYSKTLKFIPKGSGIYGFFKSSIQMRPITN